MGSVFKAVDLTQNRGVALKILRKECSANEAERAKLEEEARVTASINHPHVVKVFSFGEDHGQFYLAMELAEKGSLDDLMGIQQRLSEVQVLQIGIQIAGGLEAALEHNLIHRDIKPGNILLDSTRIPPSLWISVLPCQ
jgi:serine/threonine protein kinase